jgi:hypothetical protein
MPEKRVIAKFHPQAWINDYAVDIDDGACDFDVTDQIVAMGKEAAMKIKDDSYEADNLWHNSPASEGNPHHGPFRIEVEVAILEFFGE